jgi:hypothetical protein
LAESKRIIQVGLLVAVAIMLMIGAARVRAKRTLAIATVDDIEAQLAALDPVTRAAVVARLAIDAEKTVKAKRARS